MIHEYYNIQAKKLIVELRQQPSKKPNYINSRIAHLHLNNRIFCGINHDGKTNLFELTPVGTNKQISRIRKLCELDYTKNFKSLETAIDYVQERLDSFWCSITETEWNKKPCSVRK
jgi:hypothetical protein